MKFKLLDLEEQIDSGASADLQLVAIQVDRMIQVLRKATIQIQESGGSEDITRNIP